MGSSISFWKRAIQRFINLVNNVLTFKKIILTWTLLIVLFAIGLHFHLDTKIIVIVLSILAFLTKAFSGLMILIGLIPVVGPVLVQALSLPLFWLLNALGYIASFVAIKKGHSKQVITYRILTITFLFGVLLGYVIGRLVK